MSEDSLVDTELDVLHAENDGPVIKPEFGVFGIHCCFASTSLIYRRENAVILLVGEVFLILGFHHNLLRVKGAKLEISIPRRVETTHQDQLWSWCTEAWETV